MGLPMSAVIKIVYHYALPNNAILIAAFFPIATRQRQADCLPADESVYNTEYYPATKEEL